MVYSDDRTREGETAPELAIAGTRSWLSLSIAETAGGAARASPESLVHSVDYIGLLPALLEAGRPPFRGTGCDRADETLVRRRANEERRIPRSSKREHPPNGSLTKDQLSLGCLPDRFAFSRPTPLFTALSL